MNKHKEKHHPPEEVGKTAMAAEAPAPSGGEPPRETAGGQKPQPAVEPTRSEDSGRTEAGKMKKAEEEIVQLKDQLLRLRADFDNFRKRSFREKGEIYENANEALMLELLPVIDHIQLAVKSARDHKAHSTGSGQAHSTNSGQADSAFQEGLQLIADQLMNTLSKFGLDPFNSEKQPFDPNMHEAISCLPSGTEPEGIVVAQSRQGYRFKNKILRPAQVVVSSGRPKPAGAETEEQPEGD